MQLTLSAELINTAIKRIKDQLFYMECGVTPEDYEKEAQRIVHYHKEDAIPMSAEEARRRLDMERGPKKTGNHINELRAMANRVINLVNIQIAGDPFNPFLATLEEDDALFVWKWATNSGTVVADGYCRLV